eukprot:TRINITY_DN8269_c1_g1_i1.p1 TRINITY_DN8269_c1_g1~~TRINITY_DN8269_c1_g1_i1.p1  ORF type:complete len:120 (+),score=31.22 TRINITY_DN8269_c1_g1_i1:34-393(+)
MLRRCTVLGYWGSAKTSLNSRVEEAQILKTGGRPRINESPQGIAYQRKKVDYVKADSIALKRQRQLLYNTWRTVPVLYDLVEEGVPLYKCGMLDERAVVQCKDRVIARRRLKAVRKAAN